MCVLDAFYWNESFAFAVGAEFEEKWLYNAKFLKCLVLLGSWPVKAGLCICLLVVKSMA